MMIQTSARTGGRSGAPSRLARILVAADGTPASRGALRVASLLARRDDAAVDVVSVLDRWGPPEPVHQYPSVTSELMAGRLSGVLPEARAVLGDAPEWRVRIVDGASVASTLASLAGSEGYDLIVVGTRRRWLDRLLRRSTAADVAHRVSVPVLVVPPSADALPTRAVVGVDGGPATRAAARAAMRLVDAPNGVHVVSLRPAPGATAPMHDADAAHRLLSFADELDAGLIAVGSHRRDASLGHRPRGGVGWRVLREARCAVLLAGEPERTPKREAATSDGVPPWPPPAA